MILHFTDGIEHLNIFFERNNYNFNIYPDAHYITVTTGDLDKIYQEMDFNCYWHMDDLTAGHDTTITKGGEPF